MHAYVIFSQNAPSSQPAMRALAGWPIACIHPASQPRACIMHEDSGCTQIRSWMAGWMDGWLDACARARARMHPASQPRSRIHYACRVWMHSDQIMHCMHAEPRGSQITGRYMHDVWCMARKRTIAAESQNKENGSRNKQEKVLRTTAVMVSIAIQK